MVPRSLWDKFSSLRKLLIPGTIQMEAKIKKASSYKLNRLIRNAYLIHKHSSVATSGETETLFGRALLTFSKKTENREELGGLLWMWRKLYNLEIFEEEGCWLTSHLLAGNLAQFTICLFIISFFVCESAEVSGHIISMISLSFSIIFSYWQSFTNLHGTKLYWSISQRIKRGD